MNADEQKTMLAKSTPAQKRTAYEMGIGINGCQSRKNQQKQQKRDQYTDLDRLNYVTNKENKTYDLFGQGLESWKQGVTGKQSSKDTTQLKNQFDDHEYSVLSGIPKGGKRHNALSETLPKIKSTFLQQGEQFAADKLNERSQTVLDKGLQRIANSSFGAKDENDIQAHDDQAFELINKYVLSEAKFDEKDADAMYDKYLGYAGVDLEKARASENEDVPGAKPDFKMKDAEMYAENDTGTMSDAGGEEKAEDAELQIPEEQDEVYDGNQYRGKVKEDSVEATSDTVHEGADQTKRQGPKEATKAVEPPEQRAQLREVTPQVPESIRKKDKQNERSAYTPEPYMGRKFNTRPKGEEGPTLTFDNNNTDNPSPDLAVHSDLATAVEEVAAETGLDLNINSTTGGEHSSSQSRHYQGKAVDINKINGLPVDHPDNIENVKKLQGAMSKHKGMRECFGPHLQEQIKNKGREKKPGMTGGHKGHIHFAVQ